MLREIQQGLGGHPKELPPKYFYDEIGSQLFERISRLPEYYQTRTEAELLESVAPRLVRRYSTGAVVELGAGSATKTRVFFEAAREAGLEASFTPIDISPTMLEETTEVLRREYPWLTVRPIVSDFLREMPIEQASLPRLILFLGSTIGNFTEAEGAILLGAVANAMNRSDRFVLGVDLVKDPRILHAAYNDARGVTAAFNQNVLRVINRELSANFDLEQFCHYAFYNPHAEQIEMHLASLRLQSVRVGALDADYAFERGETIRTEISRKFSPVSAERLLMRAGLDLEDFVTDPAGLFALAVARRSAIPS